MKTIPQPTAVPAAIDALVAVFATALGSSVTVMDGPVYEMPQGKCVAVGTPVGAQGLAVIEDMVWQDRGNAYSNAFDVVCTVWSWTGDPSFQARRTDCASMLDTIRASIEADPTLGAVVAFARFGQARGWVQSQGADSTSVSVGFSVHVVVGGI